VRQRASGSCVPSPACGGGPGRVNGSRNRFENALPVNHDVIVVEAQNAKAFAGKISISAGGALLLFLFEVLSTLDLDNEPCRVGEGNHDVWANRCLATKTRAV